MVLERLRKAFAKLAGLPLVDEREVKAFLRELQRALITADVNVRLVFQLTKKIEARALHSEKLEGLTLKEHVLKVVYEELKSLLGEKYEPSLNPQKILLVGLYGSGKTTTAGKLAKFFRDRGLSVGLIACDFSRPAAREQLLMLADQAGVHSYTEGKNAEEVLKNALAKAKEDVLIIDSGGRSALDEELAEELRRLYDLAKPDEVFLVVSADLGQVAGKQAKGFAEVVPITGVIVTKMEGSGKGGGALSAVAAAGAKVTFVGTGEKLQDIEPFDPEPFVKKMLGLPDLDSLLKKLRGVEEVNVEDFSLESFLEQIKSLRKMGPVSQLFQHFGMYDVPDELVDKSERQIKHMEAIVNSMTREERKHPELVLKQRSRAERIAKGSGTTISEVTSFVKLFLKMKKMAKQFKRGRSEKQVQRLLKRFGLGRFFG